MVREYRDTTSNSSAESMRIQWVVSFWQVHFCEDCQWIRRIGFCHLVVCVCVMCGIWNRHVDRIPFCFCTKCNHSQHVTCLPVIVSVGSKVATCRHFYWKQLTWTLNFCPSCITVIFAYPHKVTSNKQTIWFYVFDNMFAFVFQHLSQTCKRCVTRE